MKRVARAFKNISIKSQLLLVCTGLFLVVMILVGTAVYSLVRQTIKANIESELKNSTHAILNMVQTAVDTSIRNHLRSVAETNLAITKHYYKQYREGRLTEPVAMERAREALLAQVIGRTGYIYGIDSSGVIQFHPENALLGSDLSGHSFIQAQVAGKEGYLEYDWANPGEKRKRAKALYMTWFAPWDWIISASSYRKEFLELIDIEDFKAPILSHSFGKTGYSFVMDGKGTLVIHPGLAGTSIIAARDAGGRLFIKEVCEKKNGEIIYPWMNPGDVAPRQKLVIFNYIPELDWIVASSSYLEEFYEPLRSLKYSIIGIFSLLIILGVPVTLRISASITDPVEELMRGFTAGARGDYSSRMKTDRGGEIGRLAEYFNLFMSKFQEHTRKLLESEENYRTIFENSLEGVYRVTPEGRFIGVNPAMAAILGYESVDSLMNSVIDIGKQVYVSQKDRDTIHDLLEKQGAVSAFETRFFRRDGDVVWVSLNVRSVRDAGGNITHFEGFVCDIRERKLTEEACRESGKRMGRIIDFLPNAMMAIDREGRVIAWNHAMEELSGVGAQEIMGRGDYEYALPFYGKRRPFLADLVLNPHGTYKNEYGAVQKENHNIIAETMIPRENGDVQFLWGKAGPIFDSHGNVVGAIESIRDVTAQKRAEAALVRSNEELEARVSQRTSELSERVNELKLLNRESALLREMSEMLQACFNCRETYPIISDYAEKCFPGYSGNIYICDEENARLSPVAAWGVARGEKNGFSVTDCWALRQGKPFRFLAADRQSGCSHVSDPSASGYLCVPMNVHGELVGLLNILFPADLSAMPEELRERSLEPVQRLAITIAEHLALALTNLKLRETLHHESIIDPLTGLYNRRHMSEVLEREGARAMRHKTELGVIMIDVDHFRKFNDSYGHDCGDEVLRELGLYLRSQVRREDIACRYGGEEFALIMAETSMAETLKKAEKLCAGIRENISVRHKDRELGITVSLGASIFPDHGELVWEVVKAADEALYRAKAQGRNRAVAASPAEGTDTDTGDD